MYKCKKASREVCRSGNRKPPEAGTHRERKQQAMNAKQQRTDAKPQVSAYATEDSILLSVIPPPSDANKNPLVFVLDTSDSMGFGNTGMLDLPINTLKKEMKTTLLYIPEGTAVCVISFGSSARVILNTRSLNETERTSTMATIADLSTSGGTNLMEGLEEATKFISSLFNSEDANTLVLTDGAANTGVCDPVRLAAAIPYGAVHAIMFTVYSDIEYAKRVRDLKPTTNTVHFVQSGEDLSNKLACVVKAMKASELKIKVGTKQRIFPPSCVETRMFVLFDVDPAEDPEIEVVYNEKIRIETRFSEASTNDLDEKIIDLHVRRERAYQKICGINAKVKEESNKEEVNQEWEVVFDEQATGDLAQPDELLKDLENLNVEADSGHVAVFRSLSAVAETLKYVRADVLEIDTGTELEEVSDVTAHAGAPCYRSLGASASDGDEMPVYRSLGGGVSGVPNASKLKNARKHRLASLPLMA